MKILKKILLSCFILAFNSAMAVAHHELQDRDIVQDKALYAKQCAAYHGANLEGQPNWESPNAECILPAPPHNETGYT